MSALNRRASHRTTILRIKQYVEAEDAATKDASELREWLNTITKSFDKFEMEHLNVLDNVGEEDEDGLKTQEVALQEMCDVCFATKAKLNKFIEVALDKEIEKDLSLHSTGRFAHLRPNSNGLPNEQIDPNRNENVAERNVANTSSSAESAVNEQLNNSNAMTAITRAVRSNTKLEVMKFSGEQSSWAEWKSTFETYVHNDPIISDTEKFYYLKRSLQGVAANILKGWLTTGENYQAAYRSVVEVFENKYRMVMAHLNELFKLPHFTHENFGGLRMMIDTTKSVIRQLEIAGSPVKHWDQVIVFVLISRMSPRTLEFWENSKDLTEMPKLNELFEFLERRARSQVNFELSSIHSNEQQKGNDKQSGTQDQQQNKQKHNKNQKRWPNQSSKPAVEKSHMEQRTISCYNCQLPHPMFRCAKLLDLPVQSRINRVRELKLCLNCFSPNHRADSMSCKSNKCDRCQKAHNSLLCLTHSRATSNALVAYHEPNLTQSVQSYYGATPGAVMVNAYRPQMDSISAASSTNVQPMSVNSAQAPNF